MRLSAIVLAACVLSAPAAASAATMTIAIDSQGRYIYPFNFISKTGATTGYAGLFTATINGTDNFNVFCLDLYTDVSPGNTYTVAAYAPNDPTVAAYSINTPRAAWIYANYISQVLSSPTPAIEAAGVQLAIWDVIHDGGDGLEAGTIQKDLSVSDPNTLSAYTLADQIISLSAGETSGNAAVLLNVLGPDAAQTLLTEPRAQMYAPEPSTFALYGGALAALGFLRRRKAYSGAEKAAGGAAAIRASSKT